MIHNTTDPNLEYTVVTPIYEGPLDLLLQLIERAELDITRLSLAQVTDQYLEHMEQMSESLSAEEVSVFLVIASRLVQIKSEALLPRPPIREPGEEDPGEALARQLIIYKRFKELANMLAQKEALGHRSYPRNAPPPSLDTGFDLNGITIEDLLSMAQYIFSRMDDTHLLKTVVAAPRITIRQKIIQIASYIQSNRSGIFNELLSPGRARLDVVVTFLALLELVKRRLVEIHQDHLFGPIEFEPSTQWSDELSWETEFGE